MKAKRSREAKEGAEPPRIVACWSEDGKLWLQSSDGNLRYFNRAKRERNSHGNREAEA